MKHSLLTLLACLAVNCVAVGQAPSPQEIVAEVNDDRITRSSLAAECLQLHGEDELYFLINNTLIRQEVERQRIVITTEEIDAEITRLAKTFGMNSQELFHMLRQRRGFSPEEYQQETWRLLALGKLAGPRLNPTPAELQEAYEAEFGAAVQARQIVLATRAEAEAVLAELRQHPETFAAVAKNRSIDPITQPFGGLLRHPIRRHTMNPHVENMLFSMQPGQISPIAEDFPFPGQFTIYQCVEHLRPVQVDAEVVKQQLFFHIRGRKLQQVGAEVFKELQDRAQVNIIFGKPELYSQYPGIAAFLNGREISIRELADLCVQKHGKEVLGDVISRLLIEQACRRENIRITEQDIDDEIREMAIKHLPLLPNGAPNIEGWLRRATEESEMSIPMYRKNVVVPMLALKRLTHPFVEVTKEDIQRAYEANYGQKVRCLAILLQDQRRAQEVWQKANRHLTEANFGDLAAEYSVDPETRLGRGVIPSIARHTGQPHLEREAFSLKPGELSQIIPIDEYFVILYCIGYENQAPVSIEDVSVVLIPYMHEKKQQALIARLFERLHDQAVVHNYLTGETRNPGLQHPDTQRALQEGPVQR